MAQTAAYGTWESPIKPDHFAVGSTPFESVRVNVSE